MAGISGQTSASALFIAPGFAFYSYHEVSLGAIRFANAAQKCKDECHSFFKVGNNVQHVI